MLSVNVALSLSASCRSEVANNLKSSSFQV